MPLPSYEELYAIWLKKVAEKRAEQYAEAHPDPRKWPLPVTRLRLLLVLLLALASCGMVWWACRMVVNG